MGIKRTIKLNSGSSVVTIGEAFKRFENEKLAKGLVESTLKNYEQSLSYFMGFGNFTKDSDIRGITRDLIIDWTNTMRENELTPAAINHYLRDCRAFFYWCMHDDRKYIDSFKVEQVRGQEAKKKTYAQDELKRLLAKPKSKLEKDFVEWRNWVIVNLAYDMGARAGSLIEIRLEDINFTKRTVYLRHTKNKALAHMNISSQCAKILKEFISDWRSDAEEQDFLFCSYGNEQLTYNALAHSYTLYCKNRGVERHSLHSLRHSFATALAENTNGDMIKVQKALGHSSIDMARKYIDMANVSMGEYDNISPLARTKDKRGRPKRGVKKG